MNKFKKVISALAVSICFIFSLVSCGSQSFYQEWKEAGATIEEDNCFKAISVDDVVNKRGNKESFVIFIGASTVDSVTNSAAVSLVSSIQAEADAINYTGKVYFVNVKDYLTNVNQAIEVKNKLGSNELTDAYGLICVCYKDGNVYFDTSVKKTIPDQLKRFIIDEGSTQINFNALANYVFEYYKVEE